MLDGIGNFEAPKKNTNKWASLPSDSPITKTQSLNNAQNKRLCYLIVACIYTSSALIMNVWWILLHRQAFILCYPFNGECHEPHTNTLFWDWSLYMDHWCYRRIMHRYCFICVSFAMARWWASQNSFKINGFIECQKQCQTLDDTSGSAEQIVSLWDF